jgi:hypothetical protein
MAAGRGAVAVGFVRDDVYALQGCYLFEGGPLHCVTQVQPAGDVRTERQLVVMPLTLRRALLSPAHADRQDWIVLDDGQEVGRIYEDRSEYTPPELRWFWSITRYVPPRLNVRTHDKVGSLAEAKRCFAKAWNAAKSHANDSARSTLDALHLDMHAIAKMAAVAATSR